jgi:hypothetical protein
MESTMDLLPPIFYAYLPQGFLVYPVGLEHPVWTIPGTLPAHTAHVASIVFIQRYSVILRDGNALLAKGEPRLIGPTVRFVDERGTLVAVRASEVDLAATAAANHLEWVAGSPVPARAPSSRPGGPPR